MAIVPIKRAESTPDQRRAYARDFLNLDIAPGDNDEQVNAAIDRAAPGTTIIFVQEAPPPAAAEPAAALTDQQTATAAESLRPEEVGRPRAGSLGRGDPRYRIQIPEIETEETNPAAQDVYVGVNGTVWQLRRGPMLDVPARVVEALRLTMQEIITHDPNNGDEIRRNVQRMTFQTIEAPTPEALAAWHAETANKFNP